jgi:hypothetical protein
VVDDEHVGGEIDFLEFGAHISGDPSPSAAEPNLYDMPGAFNRSMQHHSSRTSSIEGMAFMNEGKQSQARLDLVELRLNQRPRRTLGFQTPASKLRASVASTA